MDNAIKAKYDDMRASYGIQIGLGSAKLGKKRLLEPKKKHFKLEWAVKGDK